MPHVILVVDDSATARKFATFALRARGHHVITAQDGLDALEKLARGPVDLVVTDLNMPRLDGFGLVRTLRDEEAYADLPVIILSSLTSDEEKTQGLRLGANAYLTKPFDPKRIQYEVARFVS